MKDFGAASVGLQNTLVGVRPGVGYKLSQTGLETTDTHKSWN